MGGVGFSSIRHRFFTLRGCPSNEAFARPPLQTHNPRMRFRLFALCGLVLLAIGAAADEKTFFAEHYDARLEVLHGGTLRVVETVTLHFDGGTFREFYRVVPTRSTDGIEIVSATLDGQVMPTGDGAGHVQVSRSSPVRVTWQFVPVSNSSHTFELTYLAHGRVRRAADHDFLGWRILPSEHGYRIESSSVDIILPVSPSAPASLETHRVRSSNISSNGRTVHIEGTNIAANGWLEASVRLPPGSILDAPPAWQQREDRVSKYSATWVLAGCVVFVCALALLFGVRQGYDPPPVELGPRTSTTAPPDTLPPALAGMLLTNGTATLEHAMATIFSLADRGDVRMDEVRRSFAQRTFTMTRTPKGHTLTPVEERALEIVFTGRSGTETSVNLATARTRLMRHQRRLREVLNPTMKAAGLLDEDRQAVRRRFLSAGISLFIAAACAGIVLAAAAPADGGWPMLIPLALGAAGIVAFIAHAAHTPLSNEGVRRAGQWRAFQRYLREVARDREASLDNSALSHLLPFAVALGVGATWSAYLKRRRLAAPTWFRALSSDASHRGAAFAALIASGGAGSGGHAGGGGAAGGGASGAS
jgi:uncharacterized membrane protein YgcG